MVSKLTKFIGSKLSGYIALAGMAMIAVCGLYIWGLRAHNGALVTKLEQAVDLAEQNMALFDACQGNFKINKKVMNAKIKESADLVARHAADKRLLKDSCVSIPSSGGADDPAADGYVWKGQINSADVLDYAYECGEIEIRLRALQNWINEINGGE